MKSLRDKIKAFQANYKKLSKKKMGYNKAQDLTRKTNKIILHIMLFDPIIGHTIWAQRFKRKELRNHTEWAEWLEEKGLPIFNNNILPVVNSKFGHDYKMVRILLWEMVNEFPEPKNPSIPASGDNDK